MPQLETPQPIIGTTDEHFEEISPRKCCGSCVLSAARIESDSLVCMIRFVHAENGQFRPLDVEPFDGCARHVSTDAPDEFDTDIEDDDDD